MINIKNIPLCSISDDSIRSIFAYIKDVKEIILFSKCSKNFRAIYNEINLKGVKERISNAINISFRRNLNNVKMLELIIKHNKFSSQSDRNTMFLSSCTHGYLKLVKLP